MAISHSTFNDAGATVSDFFAAEGAKYKAQGDLAEQGQYTEAASFAQRNVAFTQQSTAIKEFQTEREIQNSLGETRADVAGACFAESGSALDILRESASQGSLQKSVLATQGLITEAEAAKGDTIAGIIKGVAAVASIATGIPGLGGSLGSGGMGLPEGAATGRLY
jgi:hypothetical protein